MTGTQEIQAVSALGLPGATIIETGVNDVAAPTAQAAPAQYVSDTTGMSASQIAALDFVDANRAEAVLARDPFLHKKVTQALDHVFRGGDSPAFLENREAAGANPVRTDTRPISESSNDIDFGKSLDAITESDAVRVTNRGVVTGRLPREIAGETAAFCQAAQLSNTVANVVMDRAAKHVARGWGPGDISDADVADLQEALAEKFGGPEKTESELALAHKYLNSVGGEKLSTEFRSAGSLAFDPWVISQLATMGRSRGLA